MSLRVFSVHIRLPILLLFIAEGVVLVLAVHLATWISDGVFGGGVGLGSAAPPSPAAIFATVGLVSLLAVGLYSTRQRCNAAGLVVRVITAMTGATLLSALVCTFAFSIAIGPGTLLGAAVVAGVGVLTLRLSTDRLSEQSVFKRRVLVFGTGRQAARLLELKRRSDLRGFQVLAFVAAEGDEQTVPADRVIRRPPDLFHWARENDVDEVVLAVSDRRRDFPMDELLECRLAGIDVLELPGFLERETGKVTLDAMKLSWIVLGEGFRNSWLQQVLKRALDVIISVALLVPSVPVMLMTVVAIWIEDGWHAPVLYRQRRIGLYNQPFEVLKFRSMRVDAEADGAVWALPNDPRVTRVGAFIRSTRIDELPQLVNVLRGDMSFVGPRPERPEFVEQLATSLPFYRGRHAVKPGITGWAQLCYPYGSSEKDALEKLQYDLYYIKNKSLLLDLAIVIQTVEVVLWQKGAR